MTEFDRLPEDIRLIGRVGEQSLRPEERWLRDRLGRYHTLSSPEQWSVYEHAMRREFYRIFGPVDFDAIIEFDGYSPFWTSLMASGGNGETTRSIYLHNDMHNEWRMKFPDLQAVFYQYKKYNNLISVSKSLGDRNAELVGTEFALERARFAYCNNQINPDVVRSKSLEPLDPELMEWFSSASHNAVAIGRLSPEKDHAKLIKAFVKFHSNHPDSNLLILGDGPLRADLAAQLTNAGAAGYIRLAGQSSNPFPALRHASVFILSSLHEGQPMVLFEAMTLGVPIICTEMPGPRDVLGGMYGLIVPNSEGGLVGGLEEFVAGRIPRKPFDTDGYIDKAKSQFLDLAVRNTRQ